jgi:anti-anti-sigma factor
MEENLMRILHFPPKVEHKGYVTVITFTGRRNRGVENTLASELEGRTDSLGESHLLLDFINVEFITGVELGTLVALHMKSKASGKLLTLFNLNAHVYEVFTITKLHTLLEVRMEKEHQLMPSQI